MFCRRADDDKESYGEKRCHNGITLHYFCSVGIVFCSELVVYLLTLIYGESSRPDAIGHHVPQFGKQHCGKKMCVVVISICRFTY